MRPPRAVWVGGARFFPGSGCVVFDDEAIVELTVREEELFELLLRMPRVTRPWATLCEEMAMSEDSIKQLASGIRAKLGPTAIPRAQRARLPDKPQRRRAGRFASGHWPPSHPVEVGQGRRGCVEPVRTIGAAASAENGPLNVLPRPVGRASEGPFGGRRKRVAKSSTFNRPVLRSVFIEPSSEHDT